MGRVPKLSDYIAGWRMIEGAGTADKGPETAGEGPGTAGQGSSDCGCDCGQASRHCGLLRCSQSLDTRIQFFRMVGLKKENRNKK